MKSALLLFSLFAASPLASIGQAATPLSLSERKAMVRKATHFLLKGQHPDGSFGLESNVGITAIALRALLLNNADLLSQSKRVTGKALAFLLKYVQPDGRICDPDRGYDNYNTSAALSALTTLDEGAFRALYGHLVQEGLLSASGLTNDRERLIIAVQKWITQQQATEIFGFDRDRDIGYGGQGYGGVPVPDLSNSQFAMDALSSSGLPRTHSYYANMDIFLKRTQNLRSVNDLTDKAKFPELKNFKVQDDGGFAYSPGYSKADKDILSSGNRFARSYASMTAAGLKCLLQLGLSANNPRVQAALGWIRRHYTFEFNAGLDVKDAPAKGKQGLFYYYWTFAQAMHLLGQRELTLPDGSTASWPQDLLRKLHTVQLPDGSWRNQQSRWMEADPYLVTSYSLIAIHFCENASQFK